MIQVNSVITIPIIFVLSQVFLLFRISGKMSLFAGLFILYRHKYTALLRLDLEMLEKMVEMYEASVNVIYSHRL